MIEDPLNINRLMELSGKMDSRYLKYEAEIRSNQEFIRNGIAVLKEKGDDFSDCYAHIIEKSLNEWWDWINESKQMKLF